MSKAKKSTVDDITRKKLFYAKRFYLHGEDHARQQNPVDRMIAIHQFHAAIEIAIKAVFNQLFPDDKIGFMQFNTIVKKIRPQCPWITDSRVEFLKRLNERRNDVQHAAEVLATEHMPEYQVKSKDFLEACLSQQFGIKFEDLDIADAISDGKLRQVLLWAKELIKLEQFEHSVVFSKLVYRIAFKHVRDRVDILRDGRILISDIIGMELEQSVAYDDEELQSFSDSIYNGFRMLLSLIEEIAVQLQTVGKAGGLHKYMSMEHKYPAISLSNSGVIIHEDMPGHIFIPAKSEAEEVRDYVLNCILAWQEVGIHPKWVEENLKYFEWAKDQIEAKRKEASK